MAKLHVVARDEHNEVALVAFWCPGCNQAHLIPVTRKELCGGEKAWWWNGDLERPILSPSVLVLAIPAIKAPRCHSYVREGRIQFLHDSEHSLSGKCVELPEWTSEMSFIPK